MRIIRTLGHCRHSQFENGDNAQGVYGNLESMSALVPAVGVLSYNGVVFGPYTETVSSSCTPVPDSSGRTIAYNRYVMSFKTVVYTIPSASQTNQYSADKIVTAMRKALTKNGGPFICTGRGIGDFAINVGNVRDVKNGPMPKVLSFQPAVGQQNASIINWQIEFCIPECDTAKYKFGPLELNYTVSTQIDKGGYTTRTLSGKFVIPQNRVAVGVRFSQDCADDYREELVPPLVQGFRRSYGPWTLSEDRATLTFSVIDEEMGKNILPPGCVDARLSTTIQSPPYGVGKFMMTVSGQYEVPKNGSVTSAIAAFQKEVKFYKDNITSRMTQELGGKGKPAIAFLTNYSFTEPNYYGKREVQMTVTMAFVSSIDQILKTGIWEVQQNPGEEWRKWATSMKGSALNIRGNARLVFDVGEDRITDLCDTSPELITVRELVSDRDEFRRLDDEMRSIFKKPKKDESWYDYRNWLSTERDDGYSPTRTLSQVPLTAKTDFDAPWDILKGFKDVPTPGVDGQNDSNGGGVGNNLLANIAPQLNLAKRQGGQLDNKTKDGETTVERRVRPQVYIIMEGYAMRLGYPIPEPTLESVNGVDVIPANRINGPEFFKCVPIFRTPINDQMLYKATWRRRFAPVGDLPDRALPELPNPTSK